MTRAADEASQYGELADRITASSEALWQRHPDSDLRESAALWVYGLRQLATAAGQARAASRSVLEAMSRTESGSVNDPDLLAASLQAQEFEVAEQYHLLALVALCQPLYEAIAQFYLSYSNGLPDRGDDQRHDPWWPVFLARLESQRLSASEQRLRAAARGVDVTLVAARDRLVAHPLAGRIPVRVRDREGNLVSTGRIAWWTNEHRPRAVGELAAINAALAAADQSKETNPYELAKDLARRGPAMDRSLRKRYDRATRDLGYELDFWAGVAEMVALLEALVAWCVSLPTTEGSLVEPDPS